MRNYIRAHQATGFELVPHLGGKQHLALSATHRHRHRLTDR